ncbi:MAG: type II toxin-antitoxin system RelE/ParE family toxin [Methylovulum sp.]|uniref:type II toxin-antitoxin system RelE/ParE family toxin n=1 Tax=Methylovulum sp. TaxID=1916980 RepID=UPI00262B7595|nr:type II toxin-antitoxin system RelE/ParE family toxin [Methylovulum sp.]MDD2723608.1 type II toxin-antitoxin system RelE/ParE family toxin [Methylovulum sp.]MDD5125491.1 type II toxin-antitoxin system RelE/ParE family toxin [Methylovulum sp.]
MQQVPVYWSKAAEADLLAIIRHIRNTRPQTATQVFATIKNKAADLEIFPERGRIIPELLAQGLAQYRELIISPWRIIYRVADDAVYVLAVIDSRRNIEDILLDRLIRA